MASIRKRDGKFQVQVRRQGQTPLARTFHKLSDAKEWARLVETQADRHDLAPDRKILADITLADLVTRYRDTVTPRKKGAATEAIMLTAFLRDDVSNKSLSNLSTADFAAFRDTRLQTVKPASVRRQLMTIQAVFTKAITEWNVPLKSNPLVGLKLETGENKRQRRIGSAELTRIYGAVRPDTNLFVVPIVKFALETAMRRGEILALTWGNIDFERSSATILEAKNGYGRVIPLTRTAVSVLRQVEAASVRPITAKNPVFPIIAITLHSSWRGLVDRAKIHDLHFHDLRHEAISRLFEMGLTAPEVASISGHRTVSQLFRYAHASQASVREKMLAIGGV
jgi:integrase